MQRELVNEFGEVIQYSPPVDVQTAIVWAVPAIALVSLAALVGRRRATHVFPIK